MSKIKTSLTLLLLLSFFGCSSSKLLTRNEENKIISVPTGNNKSLFYKDGQQAFYLKCEGPSWSECIELAGIACKNKGYDVLEKNTVKIPSLIMSDKIQNEMYIACRVVDETPKKIIN